MEYQNHITYTITYTVFPYCTTNERMADKYTVSAIEHDEDKAAKDDGGKPDEESAVSTDPSVRQ